MSLFRCFVVFFLLALSSMDTQSQSLKDFFRLCPIVLLNSRFDSLTTPLDYEYDKYGYGRNYRLYCDSLESLYGLPIQKIYIQVLENDRVDAINIYLPFDKDLVARMEKDLGPSEKAWMAFPLGQTDTAGIIWDRKWMMNDLTTILSCTRYMYRLGGDKDEDLIRIRISRRREN